MSVAQQQITQLLKRHQSGDPGALDELIPLVYDKLRELARHHMARETPGTPSSRRRSSTKRIWN